jgi:iron-sulfur cluster assembly protein
MFTISNPAQERIQCILNKEHPGEPYFLRVGVESGGCSGLSYTLDFDHLIKPNDQVFEDNGVKVVIEKKSVLYLIGTSLEYTEGLNGKGFHFNNPNASRTCACGESFSL